MYFNKNIIFIIFLSFIFSITECENGQADGYPCNNVDLLAWLPLSQLGNPGNSNDIWGWVDPVNQDAYAILGLDTGTAFIRITDPENPLVIGYLPTYTSASLWRDMKVYNNHTFIVSEAGGHGMQVFDLNQLRDYQPPFNTVTFSETTHYGLFGNAHNIAINEETGFAYVVGSNDCSGGLHIVNIQNPSNPTFAGCYSQDGYTHDTQCVIYNGVDTNYVEYESYRKNHTAANEDLFTFDVMSENSQVKDFDLEFKLPDDNIGNMYAIQGMSHGNSLFSLSKDIQNAASVAGVDLDSLSILYEPDLGTYRLEQSLNENKDAQAFQVFNEMADFLYTPAGAKFSTANDEPPNLLKADLYKPESVEEELVDAIPGQVSKADMIKRNDNIMLNSGYQVAKTAKEYFDTKIGAHVLITEVPSLLPYTLNLTIYGISSIIPGDIFRVNYLPKMYQENTYAQTMKVSHDIGSGGWYTTLETQFRLNSELREKQANLNPNTDVHISAAGLQTLQLSPQQCRIYSADAEDTQIKKSGISSKNGGLMNFQKFTAFMTRCNIYRNIDTAVDFMVFFTASQDVYHIFGPHGFTIWPTYGWQVKFGSYYTGKWVSKTKIDGTLNWGWEDANSKSGATTLFKQYDMDGGNRTDSFQNNNKGYFTKQTGLSGNWRYGGWSVLDGGTSIPTQIGIRPPTCKIVAGERYRMLVRGDKWFVIPYGNNTKGMGENSIFSKETTNYKGVLKFWEDYGGYIPKNRRDMLKHKTSNQLIKPIYEGPGYEK